MILSKKSILKEIFLRKSGKTLLTLETNILNSGIRIQSSWRKNWRTHKRIIKKEIARNIVRCQREAYKGLISTVALIRDDNSNNITNRDWVLYWWRVYSVDSWTLMNLTPNRIMQLYIYYRLRVWKLIQLK